MHLAYERGKRERPALVVKRTYSRVLTEYKYAALGHKETDTPDRHVGRMPV